MRCQNKNLETLDFFGLLDSHNPRYPHARVYFVFPKRLVGIFISRNPYRDLDAHMFASVFDSSGREAQFVFFEGEWDRMRGRIWPYVREAEWRQERQHSMWHFSVLCLEYLGISQKLEGTGALVL